MAVPDGGPGPPICDFLGQDCPAGEKCVAFDNDDDDSADETRCVPLGDEAGGEGEPCTPADPSTGIDDCDVGLTCSMAASAEPVCTNNCVSVRGITACADAHERCIDGGGPLKLCVAACNPLGEDCGAARGCYPFDEWFRCLPDSSGDDGARGDPCGSFANVCDPGLFCAPPELVPSCGSDGCCHPFCDANDPQACDTEETCGAWTELDALPPSLDTLGFCQPS